MVSLSYPIDQVILFISLRLSTLQDASDMLLRPANPIWSENKAGYAATLVVCGWAGALLEKVTRASGQEPYAQKSLKTLKK